MVLGDPTLPVTGQEVTMCCFSRPSWIMTLGLAMLVIAAVGCGEDVVSACSEEQCSSTTTYSCSPSERSTPRCQIVPINEGEACFVDGVSGFCLEGVCGAPGLCEGVECDDSYACTFDECAWSGRCTFTPIDCIDDNYCTEDWCDPADGSCQHVAKADGTDCGCWFGGGCEDGECKCELPVISF